MIQIGGLLKVAGVLGVFGIQEGEDLQLSPDGQEKANALLGWIQAALEGTQSLQVEKVEQWKKKVKRL